MRDKLIIIGGLLCAVVGFIPIVNKTGSYSDVEIVLNASGLYIGSGLVVLGASFDSKHWPFLRTISVLLISFGIIWLYDNYIDLNNTIHTYHYTVIIFLVTVITLILCLYLKLRRN